MDGYFSGDVSETCWKQQQQLQTVIQQNNTQLLESDGLKISSSSVHHSTTSLNRWYKAGWIHGFMLFNQTLTIIQMSQQKLRLIRPANIFPQSCFPILVSPCGLHLQFPVHNRQEWYLGWSICFKVQHIVHPVIFFVYSAASNAWVRYCCLSINSNLSGHCPLTSARHIGPEDCPLLPNHGIFIVTLNHPFFLVWTKAEHLAPF